MSVISLEALSKRYPKSGGGETTIFENLWLSVNKGEFVCIIGH
jgi:nitrate/nitrite transport system ATP-binding protein